jgi:hypothetical protein
MTDLENTPQVRSDIAELYRISQSGMQDAHKLISEIKTIFFLIVGWGCE